MDGTLSRDVTFPAHGLPCNNAGVEVRAWLEQEAPARVHNLSGGLAQCAWLCVAAPRAAAPIAAAGSQRHPIPHYLVVDLDNNAPWQPAAWSARVEKNEACFRAPLTLRGGFGVIGMSGGNVKPTTSSGLYPQKSLYSEFYTENLLRH